MRNDQISKLPLNDIQRSLIAVAFCPKKAPGGWKPYNRPSVEEFQDIADEAIERALKTLEISNPQSWVWDNRASDLQKAAGRIS